MNLWRCFYPALFVTVLLLGLVACIVPTVTPTQSPLPTPTLSPLVVAGDGLVEFVPIKTMEVKSFMDAELLAGVLGVVLSLVFSYVPGVKGWFEALQSSYKQALMGVGLLLVAAATFGLSCAGLVDVGVTCDQAGALGLVNVLISALVANQGAYLLTKK